MASGGYEWEFMRLREEGRDGDPSDKGASLWKRWDKPRLGQTEPELWWLLPSDVLQHGLTDQMREGLGHVQEPGPVVASGPREGQSEATVGPDPAPGPTVDPEPEEGPPVTSGTYAQRGAAGGWRWERVRDSHDCPECKGQGDVDVPGTDGGVANCGECDGLGVEVTILWAIDNRPQVQAWYTSLATTREPGSAPKLQQVVLPDDVVQAIASPWEALVSGYDEPPIHQPGPVLDQIG